MWATDITFSWDQNVNIEYIVLLTRPFNDVLNSGIILNLTYRSVKERALITSQSFKKESSNKKNGNQLGYESIYCEL